MFRSCAAAFLILFSVNAVSAPSGTSDLPLPSELPLLDYEAKLYPFVAKRTFAKEGWKRDKRWRDTGPFLLDTNYGTHPAVRIYYSPGLIDWLEGGAQRQGSRRRDDRQGNGQPAGCPLRGIPEHAGSSASGGSCEGGK
ncbi:hypothetical protein QW131_31800 [Roseibium salinum]|nr:hypothetical protein [Roseibium salinum]